MFKFHTFAKIGRHRRAIKDYNNALKLDPKLAMAYSRRGVSYKILGKRDKAIADLRKALEIDPADKYAKQNLKVLGVQP